MSESFASLCFLSYQRPAFICEAIRSAVDNADYPCEVIVHDDGSTDPNVRFGLVQLLDEGYISHLVLNQAGWNEGVGTAINRMFNLAIGDVLIKIDQDLLFTDGWLARTVGILRHDDQIGMLGLFKYHHEPVRWQDMKIEVPSRLPGYHYTRQFCGSAMAIPRSVWEELGPMDQHLDAFNEDSNYMLRIREADLELALPDVDLCQNRGFGIGPSTVVEEGYKVATIHHGPYVVDAKTCAPQTGVISPPYLRNDMLRGHLERDFLVGIVITTCAGREENLKRAMSYVHDLTEITPSCAIIVADGGGQVDLESGNVPVAWVTIPKHSPGQTQPRNVGFNALRHMMPDCTHVWFLDSDLIVPSDTLTQFYRGLCAAEEDRVLIGPYDWLPQGRVGFVPEMKNFPAGVPGVHGIADYRWPSFNDYGPEVVHQAGREPFEGENDDIAAGRVMGAGLACFGGNLVYPVGEFERIGGFHIELNHGRCEDGEMGLRAAEMGVPMSFVPEARGWHVWHPVDSGRAMRLNARDVPLLDQMHPGAQNRGLIVVDKDGKRFDYKCPQGCGTYNSLEFWSHAATHR